MKRKLAYNDNEHTNADKRLKISPQDNSLETLEETTGCTRSSVLSVPEAIDLFHQNISVRPEYIYTCCDQLWYRSSVSKCMLHYISHVQEKFWIYVLLVSKALMTLNGYAVYVIQT